MPKLKVIASYLDGRMVKGTTNNVWPNSDIFHILLHGSPPSSQPQPITVDDLKALFVVKDLNGDPKRTKKKHFDADDKAYGQKLAITFHDGETFEGSTMDYDPSTKGFFLFPADHDGNNEKVFVVNSSVTKVHRL